MRVALFVQTSNRGLESALSCILKRGRSGFPSFVLYLRAFDHQEIDQLLLFVISLLVSFLQSWHGREINGFHFPGIRARSRLSAALHYF